jgi:hypothetical protein
VALVGRHRLLHERQWELVGVRALLCIGDD